MADLRHQLTQLQALHASGRLPAAEFEERKAALERSILDLVMRGAADAAPVTTASAAHPERSRKLLAALAAAVLMLASAGYWYTGSPEQLSACPRVAAGADSAAAPAAVANATSQDQMADRAEQLAGRLLDTPEDADGWATLARTYTVLGRHPEALVAYEKAVKPRGDDASLLADYADSLAIRNGRRLEGEPMQWVEAALQLDPRNPKALALAGTHAFGLRDFASAVRYWEQVVRFGPPDSGYVQQVQAGLVRARQLGGLPPAPEPLASAAQAAGVLVVQPDASVSGTVSLAPELAKLASPDDTVFIYARAADGAQRMPLAIQRIQVRQLPYRFMLDDSASMSPAARLSGVKRVVVSARVSKSGQAMPAAGDLTGQTAAVDVGTSGLDLEIREQLN